MSVSSVAPAPKASKGTIDIPQGTYIANNGLCITQKLGSGAFGSVFQAVYLKNFQDVAVKVEAFGMNHRQLKRETELYKAMKGSPVLPKFFMSGQETKRFKYLAMELLGNNLEQFFNKCGRRFSPKTVALLATQMIECVEAIHYKGYIHRDLKPENFLMGYPGTPNEQKVFLIDFGLCNQYRAEDGAHKIYREDASFVGTCRYASVNAHLGVEQSRRDDLISIGYILMYFLRGDLPWQEAKVKGKSRKAKHELIGSLKMMTSLEELCGDFPAEFRMYMDYVSKLAYDETPNYVYMRYMFYGFLQRTEPFWDNVYDWVEQGKGGDAAQKGISTSTAPSIALEQLQL